MFLPILLIQILQILWIFSWFYWFASWKTPEAKKKKTPSNSPIFVGILRRRGVDRSNKKKQKSMWRDIILPVKLILCLLTKNNHGFPKVFKVGVNIIFFNLRTQMAATGSMPIFPIMTSPRFRVGTQFGAWWIKNHHQGTDLGVPGRVDHYPKHSEVCGAS